MSPQLMKFYDLAGVEAGFFAWITSGVAHGAATSQKGIYSAMRVTENPPVRLQEQRVPCVAVSGAQMSSMLIACDLWNGRMMGDYDRPTIKWSVQLCRQPCFGLAIARSNIIRPQTSKVGIRSDRPEVRHRLSRH